MAVVGSAVAVTVVEVKAAAVMVPRLVLQAVEGLAESDAPQVHEVFLDRQLFQGFFYSSQYTLVPSHPSSCPGA